MKTKRIHGVLAAVFGVTIFGVTLAVATHAASIDLNRGIDAIRGVATAVRPVDEKQEISVGRNLAGTVLGAAPLVNDPALQSYVNKVGRWIASQSERPDLPWHFGVIETPGINAFATPGGYVLVTRGLYDLLENESQLAGVLGHEIAHIVKRHHITVMQKQGWVQGLSSGAQAAAGSRGGAVGDQLAGAFTEILTKGLDKDAEYEADHLGVVLAARAGYTPYGLVDVLHKLQARGANDSSLALLFATHPAPGDRLGKLGSLMTPRIATLPAGQEPRIQAVSADVPAAPARTSAEAMPAGARTLQDPGPGASPPGSQKGGFGIDPGGLLRGIMGR